MDHPLNIDALRRELQAGQPEQPVELIETHISWVLLCEDLAYKFKKPVDLGFLDFSQPPTRRHACDEEVRLNRRLAPSLYIDVLSIRGTPEAPTLRGEGEPIDHAVRMRRFPDGALFSERLAAGNLTAEQAEALGRRIGEFHLAAPRASAGNDEYGTPRAIEAVMADLLSGLQSPNHAPVLAALRDWVSTQTEAMRPVWSARREAGMVRECHGDLHLANATVVAGEVTAFDCIEFDPALRWIDVMNDAAFMVMDLVAHGRRDLAFRFLDAWLETTGDHDGLRVLRYYMVARALVRARVAALREPSAQGLNAAPDYMATASSIATSTDAKLMITHGLSGSGKSFVSQRVLEHVGAVRIRSDVERKRLFGLRPLERSSSNQADGIYTPDATRRTFEALRARAALSLDAGFPTIVDAAFLRRGERAMMAALAAERHVSFCILHCHAAEDTLRHRIEARLAGRGDASEADERVLRLQMEVQEDFLDDERSRVIDVDTSKDFPLRAICERWARPLDA